MALAEKTAADAVAAVALQAEMRVSAMMPAEYGTDGRGPTLMRPLGYGIIRDTERLTLMMARGYDAPPRPVTREVPRVRFLMLPRGYGPPAPTPAAERREQPGVIAMMASVYAPPAHAPVPDAAHDAAAARAGLPGALPPPSKK